MWLLPSPARHGGCKKDATAAPLALSLDRERDLEGQGEGSGNGHGDGTKKITNSTPVSRLWVSIFGTPGFSARHAENDSITRIEVFAGHHTIESLQIIVTVPVLLDLLLCHSRAWLPREESRSLRTSSSGIRDSSRASRHARGNHGKIRPSGRACHYRVQDSIVSYVAAALTRASRRLQKRRNRRAACPLPGQGEGSGNGCGRGLTGIGLFDVGGGGSEFQDALDHQRGPLFVNFRIEW